MRQPLSIRRLLLAGTLIVLAAVALRMWLAPVCSTEAEDESVINITYPYVANPDRERQIRDGFKRVQIGASISEVSDALGIPDEVHPLHKPMIWKPPRIGTTYWYFLEKKSADNNNDTKVVRVSFDLDGRVNQVDHWGLGDDRQKTDR